MNKRDKFIEKSNKIHNNFYDYSLVDYFDNKKAVYIICPLHGIFPQIPYHHTKGSGCPTCAGNKISNKEEFIAKSIEKHGDKFDYLLVKYINAHKEVKIKCKEHDIIFKQTPNSHLKPNNGCPECRKNIPLTNEEFIRRSKEINGDKLEYTLMNYIKSDLPVKLICKIHNYVYEQTPNNHLSKKHDCPLCGNAKRRLSRIKQISEDKFNGNQVIPSYNRKGCESFDIMMKENDTFIHHAMNGGEYYLEEMGYWLDGYDKINNIVYEYDEKHHFDKHGNLREKDLIRQHEIEKYLKCKFIRIKDF